ncbi:hypothetical protein CEUSTIGMA_g10039.t1 [Chlamydomonas eustigma]|uniref:Mitochondrial transcription termination factor family protein n=1 Tax=Chlamydomonas eustigma TaxID=1157962 RepID=A0A250XHT9_9CHLO|nr:hypothetical protein CEUSTIGMA_g10039.t1 [Chlamydomonas eustigma]|eukprot:GAX82613.1 hypothetical protein CEUSTIGMA_g10039.t1 [Chlamydomonas eustigma]
MLCFKTCSFSGRSLCQAHLVQTSCRNKALAYLRKPQNSNAHLNLTTSRWTWCRAHDASSIMTSPQEVKELLSAEQLEDWTSCVSQLVDVGLTEEEAERALSRGFAWTSRAYWGLDKLNAPPDSEQVLDVLQYLEHQVGLTGAELVKVLKMFPEVLACSLETRVIPNVQRFEKDWFMKGTVLKGAIVRKPSLLGLSVDCSTVGSGACMGQCSKCWSAN